MDIIPKGHITSKGKIVLEGPVIMEPATKTVDGVDVAWMVLTFDVASRLSILVHFLISVGSLYLGTWVPSIQVDCIDVLGGSGF